MSKPILGVDVSKLDLSISLLIDKKYYKTKIDNNQQGFKTLIKWLQKHEVTKVSACLEATGSYGKSFADFLYSNNHEVSVVNPSCISAFARSKLSRHKTALKTLKSNILKHRIILKTKITYQNQSVLATIDWQSILCRKSKTLK